MKKIISVSLALALCLMLFSACGKNTDTPSAEKPLISPRPNTIDLENITDGTIHISLEKKAVSVDDSGYKQMTMTVYASDLYNVEDISKMKVGDTIVRLGKKVEVKELERLDSGLIHINGGEENGGFDLFTNASNVYFEIGMNDARAYYELGTATLPFDEYFTYQDASDPAGEIKIYNAEDLLKDDAVFKSDFNPNNTTAIIQNGKIVEMTKSYTP